MIKIYLAGSTREPERIQGIAAQLEALGCYEITHRWWLGAIEAKARKEPVNGDWMGDVAEECLAGIREAEWLVLVSPLVADANIGRWIEFGYALASSTRTMILDCKRTEEPSVFKAQVDVFLDYVDETLSAAAIASQTSGGAHKPSAVTE